MEKAWYKVWPEDVPRHFIFEDKVLENYVEEHATTNPDDTAVYFYGKTITYGELAEMYMQLAAQLHARGVGKGDTVALYMENSPQFIMAFLAVQRLGAIAVPMNPMFKRAELSHLLGDAEPKAIFIQENLLEHLCPILPEFPGLRIISTALTDFAPDYPELPMSFGPVERTISRLPGEERILELIHYDDPIPPANACLDDTAVLQYTSGTTGMPKGAELTHRNIVANAFSFRDGVRTKPCDRHLAAMPLFHVIGLVNCMGSPLCNGGAMMLFHRFVPDVVLEAIHKLKIQHWVSTATMNIAVINHPNAANYDLSSLSGCLSGGAPVPKPIFERFYEVTRTRLLEGYGLSETTAQITMNFMENARVGSAGIPLMDADVRVVAIDDPTVVVPIGQQGELAFKGPMVMRGYWKNPEATAAAFVDGWFLSGDLGNVDEDGYVHISGRKKELIKSSGFSVFPNEVESIMHKHTAIKEVCVVGVAHDYRGEEVKAYIVLKDEAVGKVTEQDIVEWAKEHMAVYKYPRKVEFLSELPKTGSGKLLRRVLYERANQIQKT
ncbi:AMP-binding protein [Paenibacillus tyrfis]|uniref:AMP-binding protein n=1 Tax=Paenibacillus tyrfis TaxID=1501230 RepID=UPI000B59446E|nr:AMP-binding protein [Paenibacillus tyrfis]